MVNNNGIPMEVKKPVETVYELKNDYEIPSFEEFMKNYSKDKEIVDSYADEFESYEDVRINRSYGPGNSNSRGERNEGYQTANKWIIGGITAVTTIVCPPLGVTVAAGLGTVAGGSYVAREFVDEDSTAGKFLGYTQETIIGGFEKGTKIYGGYKALEENSTSRRN